MRAHHLVAGALVCLVAASARAQTEPEARPRSVALRNVGIATIPTSALAVLAGVGLELSVHPLCLVPLCDASSHPEYAAPGLGLIVSGLIGIAFGVTAIVIGNHRMPARSLAIQPMGDGLRILF